MSKRELDEGRKAALFLAGYHWKDVVDGWFRPFHSGALYFYVNGDDEPIGEVCHPIKKDGKTDLSRWIVAIAFRREGGPAISRNFRRVGGRNGPKYRNKQSARKALDKLAADGFARWGRL